MSSVTERIAKIKQPYGGYIPSKVMTVTQLNDNNTLHPLSSESVHPSIMGLMVDYMTRFMLFKNAREAFGISLLGAEYASHFLYNGMFILNNIKEYIDQIHGLDDMSLTYARHIVKGDCWFRTGQGPFDIGKDHYKYVKMLDRQTLDNAKIMINRALTFTKLYGPITKSEFTFENGYTSLVDSGDGDFLTNDCLWDFKVSVKKPTKNHTLQLLMYYLMGKHSKKPEFNNIKKIGVFNPRLNIVYQLNVSEIDSSIIQQVEYEVIGYKDSILEG